MGNKQDFRCPPQRVRVEENELTSKALKGKAPAMKKMLIVITMCLVGAGF